MCKLLWALSLLTLTELAQAGSLSYSGSLDLNNPNDVFLAMFTLSSNADLHIQTWGYGGTANAPGGMNTAGAMILPGGFDPYISLFTDTGMNATFLASNDDGLCPPGTLSPTCADSTLDLINVAAGSYTLALTLPFNFSFAENLGSGTLGDGFIGLDADFSDGSCGGVCTSGYAIDIAAVGIMPIPTPDPLTLVVMGILGWGAWGLLRSNLTQTRA